MATGRWALKLCRTDKICDLFCPNRRLPPRAATAACPFSNPAHCITCTATGCRLFHFVAVLTRREIEAQATCHRTLPYLAAQIQKCLARALLLLLECSSDPQRTLPVGFGTVDTLCTKEEAPTFKQPFTTPIIAESNLTIYHVPN